MIIHPCGYPETLQDIAVTSAADGTRTFYGLTLDNRVLTREDGTEDWKPALPDGFGPVYSIAVVGRSLLLVTATGIAGLYDPATPGAPHNWKPLRSPPITTVTGSATRRVCYGVGTDGHVYQFGYNRKPVQLGGKTDTFCSVAVDQTGKELIAARDFEPHTDADLHGRVAFYDWKAKKWSDFGGDFEQRRFQSVAVARDKTDDFLYEFAGSTQEGWLWGCRFSPGSEDQLDLQLSTLSAFPHIRMDAQADIAAVDEYGHPWCSRGSNAPGGFICNILGESALGDLWLIPGDDGCAGWRRNRRNYDLFSLLVYPLIPNGAALSETTQLQVVLRFHEGGMTPGPWGVILLEDDVLADKPACRLGVLRAYSNQPQVFDLMVESGHKVTDERFRARLLHRSSGRFLSTRPLDDDNNSAVLRIGGSLDATVLTFDRT